MPLIHSLTHSLTMHPLTATGGARGPSGGRVQEAGAERPAHPARPHSPLHPHRVAAEDIPTKVQQGGKSTLILSAM